MSLARLRLLVQLLSVALILAATYLIFSHPTAVCWGCPLWYLQSLAGKHILSRIYLGTSWSPFEFNSVWIAIAIFLPALIVGRFFCGWVCPFGTFFELIDRTVLAPIKKWRLNLIFGRWFKYVTLAGLIIAAIFVGRALFCDICPAGFIFRGLAGKILIFGFPLAALSMVSVALFGQKGWCSYLCPFGGLLAIPSSVEAFPITTHPDECDGCGRCNNVCLMGIDVASYVERGTDLKSVDCNKCLRCVEKCQRAALRWPGFRVTGDRVTR